MRCGQFTPVRTSFIQPLECTSIRLPRVIHDGALNSHRDYVAASALFIDVRPCRKRQPALADHLQLRTGLDRRVRGERFAHKGVQASSRATSCSSAYTTPADQPMIRQRLHCSDNPISPTQMSGQYFRRGQHRALLEGRFTLHARGEHVLCAARVRYFFVRSQPRRAASNAASTRLRTCSFCRMLVM